MGLNSKARLAALAGAAALVVGATFAPRAGATMGDHSLDVAYSRLLYSLEVDFTGPDAAPLDALYALGPCLQVTVSGATSGPGTSYVRPARSGKGLWFAMADSGIDGSIAGPVQLNHPTFAQQYLVDGEHPQFEACTRAEYEASTSTTSTSTTTTTSTSTTSTTVPEPTTSTTSTTVPEPTTSSSQSTAPTTAPATTDPVDTGPVDTDLATTTTAVDGAAGSTAPGPLPVTGGGGVGGWALAALVCGGALAGIAARRPS